MSLVVLQRAESTGVKALHAPNLLAGLGHSLRRPLSLPPRSLQAERATVVAHVQEQAPSSAPLKLH